jgi:hypothetical protein
MSIQWYTLSSVDNYEVLLFESRWFSSTDIRREVAGSVLVDILRNKVHANVLDYMLWNRLFSHM